MDTVARATEIVKELARHVVLLKGWRIVVHERKLPVRENEEYVDGWIVSEPGFNKATIWVDTGFPAWNDILALDELMAHELGHLCLMAAGAKKDVADDDEAANAVGALLIQWAAERAGCKCKCNPPNCEGNT